MPQEPAAVWEDGRLRSSRFGDIYFSADGGLDETRAVFLAGCHLPDGWRGRRHFTVAELGFGTGLNMLATLALWEKTRPANGHLHLFSIEGFPLPREDAARALAAFPEVAHLAGPLLARWPARPGWHRLSWRGLNATLDVAVGDAASVLPEWNGRADAWFLDGFAPARNPEMWTAELIADVARHARPGARLATYTVASVVRQNLVAAGFAIARQPGFGHKRERLEATLPGPPPAEGPTPDVAIVGGGIAASSLARAFAASGAACTLYADGGGASHNSAALVAPILPQSRRAPLYLPAFARAAAIIADEAPNAILARGLLRFPRGPREARRLARAAERRPDLFAPVTQEEASALLGEPAPGAGVRVEDALVINPDRLHRAFAPVPVAAHVTRIARDGDRWRLDGADGPIATADIVVVAAGLGATALTGRPLAPARGQLALADVPLGGIAAADGHYLVPTARGLLFGATNDYDDADPAPRAADMARNIARLADLRPRLAARLQNTPLTTETGVRAVAPGAVPYAGVLDTGLYLLAGFGGHGFTLAPLLAEHVAALAMGTPSPLPASLARLVAVDDRVDSAACTPHITAKSGC